MKHKIHFVLAIVITLASSLPVIAAPASEGLFSCAQVTEIPQVECEALVALYNSTNGNGWMNNTGWLETNTPGTWYGVTVYSGHVTDLEMNGNQLNGSIPSELGNLIDLKILYLGENLLEGDVPDSLINLVNLCPFECGEEAPNGLYLDYNYLNIPPGYPDPGNPFHVFLKSKDPWWHVRQISDFVDCSSVIEIPQIECQALVSLYNSTNGPGWADNTNWLVTNTPGNWYGVGMYGEYLTTLDLHDNQLSGSLPPELGNLSRLWSLDLFNNQLSGSIPPQLHNMSYLEHLHLDGNLLSGFIPPELGNFSSLRVLTISNNQLSGSIPSELGNLSNLNELRLSNNHLSGSIPPELGNQFPLQILYLDRNQLSGSIPPQMGNHPELQVLDLSRNKLSGSIPVELGYLNSLIILRLNQNRITGDVPSSFVNLVHLGFHGFFWDGGDGLDLASNFLLVPPGYPDPLDPLHIFLSEKDPDWHLYQGFEQVIGVGGGEITSLNGKTDFLIPEGALFTDTTFTFMPQPAPDHRSGWLAFSNISFELTAIDIGGNPVIGFNLPITVTLTYTDTDIVGAEDTLGLYYWDEIASSWMDTVTTCPGGEYTRYPDGNSFALPLCHLTEFGLFGEPLILFLPMIHR